jgi:hypothetical protein
MVGGNYMAKREYYIYAERKKYPYPLTKKSAEQQVKTLKKMFGRKYHIRAVKKKK